MPTKLPLTANYNNLNNSDVIFSDTVYSVVLGGSNTALTVPEVSDLGGTNTSSVHNYLVARIRHTPNNDIWFNINASAAVPSGSGAFVAGSVLLDNNVIEYKVKNGDTLNFLTAASNVNVSIEFYWQT